MTIPARAADEALGWARRNRVLGWMLFILVGAAFIYHVNETRAEFDRLNRRVNAIQTLLCYVVDTTRRSVAEACQRAERPIGMAHITINEIPVGLVLDALRDTGTLEVRKP